MHVTWLKQLIEKEHMVQSIFHLAENTGHADAIVRHLVAAGFLGERLSARLFDAEQTTQFASDHQIRTPKKTMTVATLIGVTLGGVTGGFLAWASGTDFVGIGEILPVVVERPLTIQLVGAVMGAIIGAAAAAWVSSEFDKDTRKFYEPGLKEGKVLICVDVEDDVEAKRAKDIIRLVEIQEHTTAFYGNVIQPRAETPISLDRQYDPADRGSETDAPLVRAR